MSNHSDFDISFDPEDPAAAIEPELFPAMAVLLAQVLDLDQATEGSSP